MSHHLPLLGPHIRNSEDKLYQACLDVCIKGIEKLPVETRRGSASGGPSNNIDATLTSSTITNSSSHSRSLTIQRTQILPYHYESSTVWLISPPVTPRRPSTPEPLHSPLTTATMNRALLHGAPVRGQAPPSRGAGHHQNPPSFSAQDARSNSAVQPTANVGGSIKLRKTAVKIVGAAAPPPDRTLRAAAPQSLTLRATGSSPVPGPVKAKITKPAHVEPSRADATSHCPIVASKSTPLRAESPAPEIGHESELDSMFARLNTVGPAEPLSSGKITSPGGPEAGEFSFEDQVGQNEFPTQVPKSGLTTPVKANETFSVLVPKKETILSQETAVDKTNEVKEAESMKDICNKDPTQLFVLKAFEYLLALPASKNASVQIIKAVSAKLRETYAPDANLGADDAERLKARYIFAIVNYINQVAKKSPNKVKADEVKKALQDFEGNSLALYGALASKGYLTLDSIEDVAGLFKMIQDILPKADSATASTAKLLKTTATAAESELASKEPTVSLKAWPSQEKREAPSQRRACILKGVSGVKSINELQALVWGGRLESITMPSAGSDFAVVRFLTPEACDKYFKDTENGIEIGGDLNKTVVFVDKQPGPSSINDVIRNCIEGDASRCVRALDAEDTWSDTALMAMACGQGVIKREVDRIKRGKTARGRYFIEFRFATIYNALNFKKALVEDPGWEACTISYATDPCDVAQGVHYKDEDE